MLQYRTAAESNACIPMRHVKTPDHWLGGACVATLLACTSCGGGDGAPSGTSGTGTPAAPYYTLANSAIVAQSSTGSSTSAPALVPFTLMAPAGNTGAAIPVPKVTWSGAAIRSAGVGLGTPSAASGGGQVFQGTVTVNLWPGAALGSGSYSGSVTLQLCYAAAATSCGSQVGAGPQSISVALQVTGAARPSTTISFAPNAIEAEGAAAQTSGPAVSLTAYLSQPSPPVYVSVAQPSTPVVGAVTYQPGGASAGTVSVQFQPPSGLQVGIHPGTLLINACLDAPCKHPLQNSPALVQITYRVIPLAGLNRWFQGGFAGKKVVVWGNSTVSNAVYFFQEFDTYTASGSALAGLAAANVFNYGNNGASLAALLAGEGPYPIAAVIAVQPDLLIVRGPLIDDVRLGQTDLAQATQLLRQALDQVITGSPHTDILLTSENSLLTTDVDGHGYVQPNSAAQQYTDIIHEAVLAMKGLYPHVEVYDIMALEYGTVCQASSPLMSDQLHPDQTGQTLEADLVVKVVGLPLLAN